MLSLDDAVTVLDACFDFEGEHREDLNNLTEFVMQKVDALTFRLITLEQCEEIFNGWLVPEPSFQNDLIDSWRRIATKLPLTAIFYDALPISKPMHYNHVASDLTSEYFRWVASVDSVVSISQASHRELTTLAGGQEKPGWIVAYPSGDHAKRYLQTESSVTGQTPYFLCVSSAEPRKRFPLVLEAFRECRAVLPDVELIVIGRKSVFSAFEDLLAQDEFGKNVRWLRSANDDVVFSTLAGALASISVGDEGLGLLPLESLSVSTPTIVGGIQPSTEVISATQLLHRVNPLNSETLAEVMVNVGREFLASQGSGHAVQAASKQNLPTWRAFAGPISSTLPE